MHSLIHRLPVGLDIGGSTREPGQGRSACVSIVENHVGSKSELIMPSSVVVYPFSIRMIVTKLGAYGNKLVGPPGDADGMLGIVRGKASPATDFVVEIFVSHGKEGVRGKPKHGVVHHRPLGRVTVMDWKRPASKRHLWGWMIDRVVFPHVPRLGRSVDLVVELVSPGSDDLLHVIVTEGSVVNHVVARIDRIHLVRRNPLHHTEPVTCRPGSSCQIATSVPSEIAS